MDASPSARLVLPRSRRIQHRPDFIRARAEGRRVVQGCLILNWFTLPSGSVSRVGVITNRKLGESVARSRARRLLREAFRLRQRHLAQPIDAVLVARASINGRKLADVDRDYASALKRAGLLREPAGSPAAS